MIHTARKMVALLTPTQRKSTLVLLALMVVGMILETFGLGLILPAIALLMENDLGARYSWLAPLLTALGNPTKPQLIIGGLAALVTIYLLKGLFLAFLAARQMRFVFDVQAELSLRLYDIYLHQPFTFHLNRNSALMIRNAGTEVVLFTFNCMMPSLTLLTEGLVVAGIAGLLLAVEPLGAILVLMVLGVCAWGFQRATRRRIARWGEARLRHEGLRTQHLQQGLGGAKEVILLGREEHFVEQYRVHNLQTARMGQFQQSLQALPRLWLEVLAVTGLAILVLAMLAQGHAMDVIVQTVGLFAAAAFRLAPAANRIINALQSLLYGVAVINTLYDEFCLPAPQQRRTTGNPITFTRDIALSNVTYAYPGAETAAINDVSLAIKKGECVGFIGHSGSGKTTLVDVVLGLLEPTAGRVLVDGRDMYEDLRSWRIQIGYVPQAIYLVDSSLRANIAFGLPDSLIDDAAVARAVRAAQLDEFIASLPDGLETVVGERGVRISGGQRQRIGIARALYHDPAVVVLDEATSSLDTATEHDVMQAVSVLRGNKTVIIVAHRLSTVEGCDRLYRLVEGRVFEEGSPAALLSTRVSATTN